MSRKKKEVLPTVQNSVDLSANKPTTPKRVRKRTSEKTTSDNHQSVSRLNVGEGWSLGTEFKAEVQHWLLENRILSVNINLLEARKGMGKSSVLTAIAAAYSRGLDINGKPINNSKPNILWIQHEESYGGAVVPRFRQFGGNPDRLVCPKNIHALKSLSLPSCVDTLGKFVENHQIGLAILDPFSALQDSGLSQNDQQGMRSYVEHLKAGFCDKGCTVTMSRHLRKGTSGNAVDQGIGSVAISAVARSVMRIDDNPTREGERLLSVIASNATRIPFPLAFRLEDCGQQFPAIHFDGELEISLDEILEGAKEKDVQDEAKDATTILSESLKNGPKWSKEIIAEAKEAGVGERTLRKAKAILGVLSERRISGESGIAKVFWVLMGYEAGAADSVAALQPSDKPQENGLI